MDRKRKVILITDGDECAKRAVEKVAEQIGCGCISGSAGNPSLLSGEELITFILKSPQEPVLVMFDDCGFQTEGQGERALKYVAYHPEIDVLGVIAVASATNTNEWTKIDVCIDRYGNLTEFGVDKDGVSDIEIGRMKGDTVHVLDEINAPIIVGVGDIGKMAGFDDVSKGAPITKKAVELIIERRGFDEQRCSRFE